ncbi:hypothetical protein SISNIDRAFT_396786, partial [Sistotremastrum niveocremeum HHB9708]
YAPFKSQLDWDTTKWLMKEGLSENAIKHLLEIPEFVEKVGLSGHSVHRMKKLIDRLPPLAPWYSQCVEIDNLPTPYPCSALPYVVYTRDIIAVIRHLFNKPAYANCMTYGPEEHYADEACTERLYNEIHTGKWWSRTQVCNFEFNSVYCIILIFCLQAKIGKGTVVPILISTDKTTLTQFSGDHTAYPVYLSIGNIDKETRKKPSSGAWVLVGYLPTGKFDEDDDISDNAGRKARARLFHASMRVLLEPLIEAGKKGILLVDPKGRTRLCYPILAIYPCDYPEQTLVCATRYMASCPRCHSSKDDYTDNVKGSARALNVDETLEKLRKAGKCHTEASAMTHLDPTKLLYVPQPFWANFPHCNIHRIITPDILHQLFQGMVKHAIAWLTLIVSQVELDSRFKRVPPAHGCRHFPRGISILQNASGAEHRDIGKQIMGCLVGCVDDDVLRATRSLLDFVYLAQYKSHSSETLQYLKDALTLFHQEKEAFNRFGGRPGPDFTYPKLHALQHYIECIEDYGSTDNYNTETTERLHINFVKTAYEHSNKKHYIAQMIIWLDRMERIQLYDDYI